MYFIAHYKPVPRCAESTQADLCLHSLIFNDDIIHKTRVEFVGKYSQLLKTNFLVFHAIKKCSICLENKTNNLSFGCIPEVQYVRILVILCPHKSRIYAEEARRNSLTDCRGGSYFTRLWIFIH